MKPKEKAKELVVKFMDLVHTEDAGAKANMKSCALICVQEIMNANPHSNPFNSVQVSTIIYWDEVKKEIEKI